jgi:hypothetical protein
MLGGWSEVLTELMPAPTRLVIGPAPRSDGTHAHRLASERKCVVSAAEWLAGHPPGTGRPASHEVSTRGNAWAGRNTLRSNYKLGLKCRHGSGGYPGDLIGWPYLVSDRARPGANAG